MTMAGHYFQTKSSRISSCKGSTELTVDTDRLPHDILWQVTNNHLTSKRDVLNLCLTSRTNYYLLIPALYTIVELKGIKRCQEKLSFLIAQPNIVRNIQQLVIRPSYMIASSEEAVKTELSVVRALELLIPNLVSLHAFVWDGLEIPADSIWLALRSCCPKLRHVSSTVGGREIPGDSQLFGFSNLSTFSFTSKWLQRPLQTPADLNAEKLPDALWVMLRHRCPQLEELTIGGPGTCLTTRLFDVRPLTKCRWPQLRSLNLGNTLMVDRNDSAFEKANAKLHWSKFIATHRLLKQLHLPSHAKYPALDINGSDIRLESYSGSFPYLLDLLPNCNLKELILCSENHPAWYIVHVRQVLQSLTSLTNLAIWIDLSYRLETDDLDPDALETDHAVMFRSIFADCPRLEHFKVLCSTKAKLSFPMKNLAQALVNGPQLKTLEVYKVYIFGEEEMVTTAARVSQLVPSLERITFRYATKSWSTYDRITLRQLGSYEVIHKENAIKPVSLLVDEIGVGYFTRFKRRYEHNILSFHSSP